MEVPIIKGAPKMILRRVIQHVRKQEWTALAIDFVIVVIGVVGVIVGRTLRSIFR